MPLKRKPAVVPAMHVEVSLPNLVLMIPLTPEDERRLEVLLEGMDDGQHEVRELGHEWADRTNQPGLGQVDGQGAKAIEDVVVILFDALDSVTEAEVLEFQRFYCGD
jgi:hypothetical protein